MKPEKVSQRRLRALARPKANQLVRNLATMRSTSKSSSGGILKPPVVKRRGKKRPVIKLKTAFKSKLEERINAQIEAAGLDGNYETQVLRYVVPSRNARYTPDFPIGRKPIYIEAKGRFRTASERAKMILVREQNPGVDIRLVFMKASLPIYKGSPTSHGKWAEDHGFQFADGGIIPDAWLVEASQ